MDRTELRQALKELVEETTGETYPDLTEDVSLREGLNLDSMDMFTLIVEMQSRFDIKIQNAELTSVERVGDLIDVLMAKVNPPGGSEAKSTAA